jgi:hypothetical protein
MHSRTTAELIDIARRQVEAARTAWVRGLPGTAERAAEQGAEVRGGRRDEMHCPGRRDG